VHTSTVLSTRTSVSDAKLASDVSRTVFALDKLKYAAVGAVVAVIGGGLLGTLGSWLAFFAAPSVGMGLAIGVTTAVAKVCAVLLGNASYCTCRVLGPFRQPFPRRYMYTVYQNASQECLHLSSF
jgi:hypothetical protein